jgi:hypothetical protein
LADAYDLGNAIQGAAFDGADAVRAMWAIARASAAVRAYTRQQITETTDTATLEATDEQWLYLPQRPVVAVISVTVGGAPLAPGMWQLKNDALYRRDGWNGRFYGASSLWNQPDTIDVDYTHGWDLNELPDDITGVVIKLARQEFVNPQGLRQFKQGQMEATFAIETVGSATLDEDDKRVLDRYRRKPRSRTLAAKLL